MNSVFSTQQALNRCLLLHLSDFVPSLDKRVFPSLNTVQMFASVWMSPSVLIAQVGRKPSSLQDTDYIPGPIPPEWRPQGVASVASTPFSKRLRHGV